MKKRFFLYSAVFASVSLFANVVSAGVLADETSNATKPASDRDVERLIKALQDQGQRLADQEKKLADQESALENQKRALVQEKVQFEKLQTQIITLTGKPIQTAVTKSTLPANNYATSTTGPQEVGMERKETKDKPPEIPAIIDEGGVLTAKGNLVVTPALEYSRSSATSVEVAGFSIIPALNIGVFDISQVNRDMLTPSIDLRYGVTNRFELETKIPYVWRQDSTLGRLIGGGSTSDSLSTVKGSGVGDIEFAAHYQINKGENNWPYFIGNLRFKTATGSSPFKVPVVNGLEQKLPTGSGFYAIQPSLTAIYPSDPLVYYGNLGYLHNFSKSYPNYGTIDPGDGFSGSFGMSLSLNDKSSFSVGYSHTMVLRTLQNGTPITNSTVLQVGTLDLGYSYSLTDATNLNFTINAGVTSDAPDVMLTFRVPMTFGLFK